MNGMSLSARDVIQALPMNSRSAINPAMAVSGGLAKDGAEAGQKGAPLSRGGGPGSVENVPHHRNGDAIANDREHQDIDVVVAEFPTRAVEGQKPRPRSEAYDPDDHTGELASV
jgi:hypothetical protein